MKRIHFSKGIFPVVCLVSLLFCLPNLAGAEPYVIGQGSLDLLERADSSDPNNHAVAFYLGKVYLAQGDTDAAIEAWERFLASAPEDGKSAAVRERLTVLKLRQAEAFARRAAQGGTPAGDIEENTIAVLNFQAPEASEGAVLSKGLTAMIITDLSKVPDLKVVEREKMQALLQEIRMVQTGIVEEETAVRAGRMLLARNLVRGSLTPPEEETIQVRSTVTETRNGTDLGSPEARGPMAQLFEMEKRLVFGILEAMGITTEEMDEETRKAVGKYHTKNVDALMSYSRGLDLLDQGEFGMARDAFETAVELDPGFDLANDAMLSTPTDLSAVEGVEGIEMLDLAEEGEGEAGGAADLEADPSVSLADLEVVDVAQDELSADLSEEVHWDETPHFPEKPDRTGGIEIEW